MALINQRPALDLILAIPRQTLQASLSDHRVPRAGKAIQTNLELNTRTTLSWTKRSSSNISSGGTPPKPTCSLKKLALNWNSYDDNIAICRLAMSS